MFYSIHVRKTTFIGDAHADNCALLDSLEHAECIVRKPGGWDWDPVPDANIVITGDLNDRGPETLPVFDTVLRLIRETRLTLLLGNHEAVMWQSFLQPEDSHNVLMWMLNGGAEVLMEIAKNYKLKPAAGAPFPTRIQASQALSHAYIEDQWRPLKKALGAEQCDFPNAFEIAQQLFRSRYAGVLDHTQLIAQPLPGVIAVHAGLDEDNARALASLPAEFQHAKQARDLGAYAHMYSDLAKPLWKENPPDEETALLLHQQGIHLLIHGHQRIKDGKQRLWHGSHGVADINLDIAMSRGMDRRQSRKERWGYVQVEEDGNIVAANSEGPALSFGRIHEDGTYEEP